MRISPAIRPSDGRKLISVLLISRYWYLNRLGCPDHDGGIWPHAGPRVLNIWLILLITLRILRWRDDHYRPETASSRQSTVTRRDSLLGTELCVCSDCKEMVLQVILFSYFKTNVKICWRFPLWKLIVECWGCSQTCELGVIVFASGDPCSENGQKTADDTVPLPQPGAKLYKRRNSLKLKKLPNRFPVKGLKLISPRFISECN